MPGRRPIAELARQENVLRVLFIFDTTGSMGSYCQSLLKTLPKIYKKLEDEFGKSKVNVGVISYKDYCDGENVVQECYGGYEELTQFAKGLSATGGGDGPEAVKTALNRAYKYVKNDGSSVPTVLLLYTDAMPHMKTGSGSNKEKEEKVLCRVKDSPGFDLFQIAAQLKSLDVTMYTLLDCGSQARYYAPFGTVFSMDAEKSPAAITAATMSLLLRGMGSPYHLYLDQFKGTMYNFTEPPALEDLTEETGSMYLTGSKELKTQSFTEAIDEEGDGEGTAREKVGDAFRRVSVRGHRTVAELCSEASLPYTRGCGYYQLTGPKDIGKDDIMVVVNDADDTVIHGIEEVRDKLGMKSGRAIKISPADVLDGWTLYIHNTAANRSLEPGTTALIYVGDEYKSPTKPTRPKKTPAAVAPPKTTGRKRKAAAEDSDTDDDSSSLSSSASSSSSSSSDASVRSGSPSPKRRNTCRTLNGKTVLFVGGLTGMKPAKAAALASRFGAATRQRVCGAVDVIVRGNDASRSDVDTRAEKAADGCVVIGEKRFQTLTADLSAAPKRRRICRSLDGKTVLFVGRLETNLAKATKMAEKKGASVRTRVTNKVDLIVEGAAADDRLSKAADDCIAIPESRFLTLCRQ